MELESQHKKRKFVILTIMTHQASIQRCWKEVARERQGKENKPFWKCFSESTVSWRKMYSVQLLSPVWLFETPWNAACQVSLSITNYQRLLMSIESLMPFNHLNPLSSPSPPVFNLSQHQGFSYWGSLLHQVDKVLEFQLQHQSFQWIFRTDFL